MQNFFIPMVDEWGTTTYLPTSLGYLALGLIMVALLCVAALLTAKDKQRKFDTKQLVFSSLAMALAVVTSMIKLYEFPFGGSVTMLSMFFICFIGYLYGLRTGLMTGFAYGILQLILGPYILFPLQVIVDYLLAFGALGLSGLFWKSKNGLVKGYLAGILGRYFFAVLSGWLFFGEYAWEGWAPLPYSLVYNGAYIFAEAAITVVLLVAVKPLQDAVVRVKRLSVN